MMHFRGRTLSIDEKQANKYLSKHSEWRKGKRNKRYRKIPNKTKGITNEN